MFHLKRLALYVFFMLFSLPAWGAADTYTVENVTVDVTAENALAARDKAFAQAQGQAFQTLVGQISGSAQDLPPEPQTISPMVTDFEITQEKLSSVRYVATYVFRFDRSAVDRYLNISSTANSTISAEPDSQQLAAPIKSEPNTADSYIANTQKTSTPAPLPSPTAPQAGPKNSTYLLIPFYDNDGKISLWEDTNAWRMAIGRSETQSTDGTSFLAPLGDLQDIQTLRAQGGPQSVTMADLATLTSRYGVDETLISVARLLPNGALTVDILAPDGSTRGQIVLTRKWGQTLDNLMDEATLALRQHLARPRNSEIVSPKIIDAPTYSASQDDHIRVRVVFKSLEEWARIQNALNRVPLVTDRGILSLSTGQAILSFPLHSGLDILQMALNRAGLALSARPLPDGTYEMTPAQNSPSSAAASAAQESAQPPSSDGFVYDSNTSNSL
jgi:hypothetical protein